MPRHGCIVELVEKYRRQAEECEAIARRAADERQRRQIRKLAEVWRKLACDRERMVSSGQHVRKSSC